MTTVFDWVDVTFNPRSETISDLNVKKIDFTLNYCLGQSEELDSQQIGNAAEKVFSTAPLTSLSWDTMAKPVAC